MIARGWLGKKSGRGFYVHDAKNGHVTPNPEAAAGPATPAASPGDTARRLDRLVLLMINEAARCLEENVVTAPDDIDFAMIFGTGWAPFRGGPLRYADRLGAAGVVHHLETLAREIAPHFAPCEWLRTMARASATFYPVREIHP
jgi:3-hydroxyacyl-CoA dehydrogenase / enoyl-CoA hydratase / 3-hydroxybutyryl-CoA epimerase